VQKAGTSWWHNLMTAHPQMHEVPGLPKELHFFDRYWNRDTPPDLAESYARWFPRPEGGSVGEWTPRYMFDPWTPALLRQAAPSAKILVLLRDPIDRFRSGLSHELDHGAVPRAMVASEAASRGLYYPQMRTLLRAFPREQVLVLQYERCCQDPLGELRRTYEFLGLAQVDFVPDALTTTVNRSRSPKATLPHHLDAQIGDLYRDDMADLAALCPEIDLGLWPSHRRLTDSGVGASALAI
jgi:hypothetical protein